MQPISFTATGFTDFTADSRLHERQGPTFIVVTCLWERDSNCQLKSHLSN